mmetsp:Transcript_11865/g.19578  ORF Transcript_11865/g.19578 Transcript_11865/m.19578 type:complete len:314 (-) Transcript_11865:13-954(-)
MRNNYPQNCTLKVKSNIVVAGTSLSGFCTSLGAGASLYFTGTECTKVVYTSSSSGSTGYPRESYSTVNIVRSIISLDWSRLSSVASFEFHIPDLLPSSMHYKDGNGSYCCVNYQLKLQLGREIIEVVPIQIISRPSCNLPAPYVEDHTRRRIMLAYCVPKGSIETSIKVDDTRLGTGEILKIWLELVNNSSVDIKRISCKLFEQIDWHSCGHYTSDTTIVASKKLSGLAGMKCNTATKPTKVKAIRPSNSDHKLINSITFEAFLRVPEHTLHTSTGNLFEIKHYLCIDAQTKCGLTNVKIRVPVQITSPRRNF